MEGRFPTRPNISQLYKLSIDDSELHKIRRSIELVALKLGNVPSGVIARVPIADSFLF